MWFKEILQESFFLEKSKDPVSSSSLGKNADVNVYHRLYIKDGGTAALTHFWTFWSLSVVAAHDIVLGSQMLLYLDKKATSIDAMQRHR